MQPKPKPRKKTAPPAGTRPAPAPASLPAAAAGAAPLFFNRELSWLEFNARILHEAEDARNPLLERLKFLGIFSSNLDEFFMKRVGGLKRQVAAGTLRRSLDGRTPSQQLSAIRAAIPPMLRRQAECFSGALLPALRAENIYLMDWASLDNAGQLAAIRYFQTRVFPVLTPLVVDPAHPFPFISNLSSSLGVLLRNPESREESFARVKIPEVLPQWVRLELPDNGGKIRFVSLPDLIRHNLEALFPNMEIFQVMPFRITRNADMERDEEDADDLLEFVEQEVRQRRFENAVRMEHAPAPNSAILALLMRELGLEADDVYEMPGILDHTALMPIAALAAPELRHVPWTPVCPPALREAGADIFSAIRKHDILVHHPYEDFNDSVERFIRQAADDPRVLAIKMAVYRTEEQSPFMRTLIRAAEAGKQIVCLVELQARFDEERNIYWAQAMEQAGIHVVYGMVGLKTHAKIAMVIRDESVGIRCYAHIGTGNYHTQTARLYTDLSLLTCRQEITDDLVALFNHLTGRSMNCEYRQLLVAPVNMRDRFLALIRREIAHQQAGRPAQITAKMNSLEDDVICQALYEASRAGVRVDLIVRGFCCLIPGRPGLSENIRVISIIGRFLEHSRIFYFRNGASDPADGEFFIGSADWMYRNLLARVEVVAPIAARSLREKCLEIMKIMLNDQRQSWQLLPDGSYRQAPPDQAQADSGTHQVLMNLTGQRAAAPASAI